MELILIRNKQNLSVMFMSLSWCNRIRLFTSKLRLSTKQVLSAAVARLWSCDAATSLDHDSFTSREHHNVIHQTTELYQ